MSDYFTRRLSYVYTYRYPQEYPDSVKAGKIFYIGAGQGKRIDDHLREARKGIQSPKCNVIREIWNTGHEVVRKKEQEELTVDEAWSLESRFIREHKCNGCLTNGLGLKLGKRDKPKISIKTASIQGDLARRFRYVASIESEHALSEQEIADLATQLCYRAIEVYCEQHEFSDHSDIAS